MYDQGNAGDVPEVGWVEGLGVSIGVARRGSLDAFGMTVTASDFRGPRKLPAAAGERFASGVVLYDGEACVPFGERMYAVPLRAMWEMV